MKKGLVWRIALSLTVLLLSVAYVLPTFTGWEKKAPAGAGSERGARGGFLERLLPDAKVNLGLDLMGGIHLTLGVETEKAVENGLARMGEDLLASASEKGLMMGTPYPMQNDGLEFYFSSGPRKAEFDELLAKKFADLAVREVTPLADGKFRYQVGLSSAARAHLSDLAVDQVLKTVRNRIDQFGVAEPDVRREQGSDRIMIQLPGMTDPKRAVSIIGKTAHLEFRMVRGDVDTSRMAPPPDVDFIPVEGRGNGERQEILAVEKKVALTGEDVENAVVYFDQQGGSPYVSLSFDRRGREIFGRLTGQNIGKRLAIVLDGKVHSAPVIQSEIHGAASITGKFTPDEASDLALVLRAGSLPAPVKVLEERTVGPSLGQESIDMGVTAALTGAAVIMVFMVVYYGLSGVTANLMLAFDILLILAGMAAFGATLTLPGIAGIVLTLGMAVDANVLIFERIREEMQKGMTVVAAVEAGFSRAMLAITDSNVTTMIAAVVLYQFGTGPIRGFAVTLTLGIAASMFTAIFVNRILFDVWLAKPGRKLSI